MAQDPAPADPRHFKVELENNRVRVVIEEHRKKPSEAATPFAAVFHVKPAFS